MVFVTGTRKARPASPAPEQRRFRTAGKGLRPLHGRTTNLFYLPAIALLVVFTVYPLINGIQLSLTNWDGYSPDREFVGVANYLRLLTDGVFRQTLLNTLIYGFGSTLIQQVLGLALAMILNRPLRGRRALRAIIYLPALVSPVVMGTMYYLIFDYNNGTLNNIVNALGGHSISWLSNATLAVIVIVIVNSLQFVGVSMVIYLAGLQSIPIEYYEAAELDGASGWRAFVDVTAPLLQPAFATSIVLNLIGGLKLFDVIEVMTNGGPGYSTNSVSSLIGVSYFQNEAAGYASAMGVVLFVLVAVFAFIMNTALNRRRLEM